MKKINAKFLPYALVLSLATTTLTACGANNENFMYSVDSTEGDINVDGTIDYELLKTYKLIELKLVNGENKLYIVRRDDTYGRYKLRYSNYIDIFTNEIIYTCDASKNSSKSDIELINEYNLGDYLITYDEIKGSYTIEDIERIYDKIKEDYVFDEEKTNSK